MSQHNVKIFKKDGCLSYLILDHQEAALIDPRLDLIDDYQKALFHDNATLKYLIDTHTHADHLSATSTLAQKLKVPIVMHETAFSPKVDRRIKGNETLPLGQTALQFHHTPGHTPDSLAIQIGHDLFTGDTLLIGGSGRTDFLGGSPESMADSLSKLRSLQDITTVYPGHDYQGREKTDFQQEKSSNPLLKQTDREQIIQELSASRPPLPEGMKGIIRFNKQGEITGGDRLSADEVAGHVAMGASIVDVRRLDEYEFGHIEGSQLIPLDEIETHSHLLKGKQAILVCASGLRAEEAKQKLIGLGLTDLRILEGGTQAWKEAGLPLRQLTTSLPIERQVRIIAGSLVLLGALLAFFVNLHFLWLAAFVGAGLIFAGVTDTCGMGILLKKMPWNRQEPPPSTSGGCAANVKGTCAVSQG